MNQLRLKSGGTTDVALTRNALSMEGKAFGEEAVVGEMIAIYLAYGAQEAYFLGIVTKVARDIAEEEDHVQSRGEWRPSW